MKNIIALFSLMRPMMLPTAVADAFLGAGCAGIVTGAVLGWDKLILACCMSLLLYASGMVMNDLFDAESDRIAGRKRPISEGVVSKANAIILLALLLCAAIVICWYAPGMAKAVYATCLSVIILYNLTHKKLVVLSPFLMGAARSLDVLAAFFVFGFTLGDIADNRIVLAISFSYGLYVTGITFFSLLEDKPLDKGYKLSAIAAILIGCATTIQLLHVGTMFQIYVYLYLAASISGMLSIFYLLASSKRRAKLGAYTPFLLAPLLLLGGIGFIVFSIGELLETTLIPGLALAGCYPLLALVFYIRAERQSVDEPSLQKEQGAEL